jgi:glycosyltransferase involved in cell wall biosynthesis
MNGAPPLVSIVINNYNYARFLPDAVESALAQSWPSLEVIVVDDGSTDGSQAVIRQWGDRIIAVFKENGGQASALNAGWARARGEVVLLLDADDVLLADAAGRAVACMAPDTAAIWAPVSVVDADLHSLGRTLPADTMPSGDVAAEILAGVRVPAPPTSGTALHRRLADVLFPIPEADWRISADAYLATLAPLAGRICALDQPAALYRVHGNNRWVLGNGLPVEWVHEQLRIDRARETALRNLAVRLRRNAAPDWRQRGAEHLQARMASLRLDPSTHPEPGDSRLSLGTAGASAAFRTRAYRPRKRLLFAGWFMLAALLPRRAAVPLIEAAYRARRRSWIARTLLGADRNSKNQGGE